MKSSFIIYLILFLNSCNPEKGNQNLSKSEKEIETLLSNYYNAMSDRNWNEYKTYFIQNAALTTIWQQETDSIPNIFSVSINEFLAQTADGPDSQPIFEEKMTESEISVKQNLAQAWVKYEAKFGTEENLMEWKGHDLFSFIKFDGQWKIVSLTYEADHK